MTTEDLNHCHWLKLLSLVHCCTPFHLCDWVMRYHRLYAPKYSCENKSGKWAVFSFPGSYYGWLRRNEDETSWETSHTGCPGPPYLNRTRRCRAENGCTGNGFNIKPSGKSWGKAEPVLKNIYVSFVMNASLALKKSSAFLLFSSLHEIMHNIRF